MQAAREAAARAEEEKAQAKKDERAKIQKRIKRRVFFMLWYGKAFTTFQVWALRALMGTVIVSALGIALEVRPLRPAACAETCCTLLTPFLPQTMSTGGAFNIEECVCSPPVPLCCAVATQPART